MDRVEGGYRTQEINTVEEIEGMIAEGAGFWSLADGDQGSPELRRRVGDLAATICTPNYFGPLRYQWGLIDPLLEEEDLSLYMELAPSFGLSSGSADGPFVWTNMNRLHVASHKPRSAFAG